MFLKWKEVSRKLSRSNLETVGLEFWWCLFLALGPWASYFISLGLGFLICKMGIRAVPTSEGHREDEGGECSILQNVLSVVLFVRGIISGVLLNISNR